MFEKIIKKVWPLPPEVKKFEIFPASAATAGQSIGFKV